MEYMESQMQRELERSMHDQEQAMSGIDADKLRALDEAATKGDLSTAERYTEHEHIECPICQGDGEVLASDYCNIDGKALGVQFYGIGNEFSANEALWTYLVHSVPAILAMAEELPMRRQENLTLTREISELRSDLAVMREHDCTEVKRMREALEKIAGMQDGEQAWFARDIAARALRTGSEQGKEGV